jgi:hypothetical protein
MQAAGNDSDIVVFSFRLLVRFRKRAHITRFRLREGYDLHAELEGKTIKDIRLVYGGMAPITIESKDTQSYLMGKEWGQDEVLFNALERLSTVDFALPLGVPGGMAVYRKSLAMGFFAKFWTGHACQFDILEVLATLGSAAVNTVTGKLLDVRNVGIELELQLFCHFGPRMSNWHAWLVSRFHISLH